MATTTPVWVESTVQAVTTLSRNAAARFVSDQRTQWGAYLLVRLGRGGTAALTNGVDVVARRTAGNDAAVYPAPLVALRSQTAAASGTTCAASGNPAGASSLTVASTTGFAAGDLVCVQDAATPTAATEWARVARVTSATVLLLDGPTKSAHNSTAHTVRNKADSWAVWLDGGAVWEFVVDYGDDSAGDAITYEIVCQVLQSVESQ
jgi:hypothetical protein